MAMKTKEKFSDYLIFKLFPRSCMYGPYQPFEALKSVHPAVIKLTNLVHMVQQSKIVSK